MGNKQLLIGFLALLLVSFAVYLNVHKSSPGEAPNPSSTSSAVPLVNNCLLTDLKPTIQTEGTAGSLYVTLTLENTSSVVCIIPPSSLQINITDQPTNVSFVVKNSNEHQPISLSPQQFVYAQIRFPNGPQCTAAVSKQIQIYYVSSNTKILDFTSRDNPDISMQVCKSEQEKTTVDVWQWSPQPISG